MSIKCISTIPSVLGNARIKVALTFECLTLQHKICYLSMVGTKNEEASLS